GSDGSLEQAASLLRALRALPASCAVPRWREALRDPREELRLLAHGLLTRREARAHVQLDRLQTLATPRERWAVLRVHAFACWELVCGERECSERALHALGDSARAALAIKPEAQLCVLLARAALRCGDGTGAAHWLQHAESLGIERERSAVLYAEAAFLAGDFAAVSRWLAQLRRRERRTDKVVKYWSSARNPSRVRPNHVA
ncbi:MAG TPA: hypothetical protein VJR89_37985, partial [Polyangiales bacterium]|nr:hypothetical protein [Polyangiales bacterium]